MGNKKLTIVKVIAGSGHPTQKDLDRWRQIFSEQSMTEEEAVATGEVFVEHVPLPEDEDHCITLVKIGNEEFVPSQQDLEDWRQVFADAQNDPNFKIFTHPAVDISVINIGKIVAVE